MQPRKPDRGRFRWGGLRLILLLLAGGFLALWFAAREPSSLQLRYGEFKRLLNVPGVTFRNVKVGKTEISGEIVTRDRISGLEGQQDYVAQQPWKTARAGLELEDRKSVV